MSPPGGADTRSEAGIRRAYRRRIALFVVAAVVLVGSMGVVLWTAGALRAVDAVGLVRGCFNLRVVHGDAGDPHLPAAGVDAILVANTFHELEDPDAILIRAREALRSGGRLVVVDPDADAANLGPSGHETHHYTSADRAEARILHAGLDVVSRDDAFVDEPGHGRWWLIVARRS